MAVLSLQNGCLHLWLHEECRQSPYIHFKDCPPPGMTSDQAWLRPEIGGVGDCGYQLRCGSDAEGALHIALPTSQGADQYIHWWREEAAE